MSVIVLDSEPLNVVIDRSSKREHRRRMQALLTAAARRNGDVVVPAAVLAELYQGTRIQTVDAGLNRHPAWTIEPTTRSLARLVGRILNAAGRTSHDHVDACVVAVAIEQGGGNVITGDPDDMTTLTGNNPAVNILTVGA